MDFNFKLELPDVFNKALTPAAERAGETLVSLWDLTFGSFENYVSKIKFKRNLELESFKETLVNEISKIPQENIIEPKLSIIGPAIEASKFYYEEQELRNMFAKLVASSMNSAFEKNIRTSFASIIKELEPIDASNMKLLRTKHALPICDVYLTVKEKRPAPLPLIVNLFVSNPSYTDEHQQSSSLTNLERLGLINIDRKNSLRGSEYVPIYENPTYVMLTTNPETKQKHTSNLIQIQTYKGTVSLTDFGRDFSNVCI